MKTINQPQHYSGALLEQLIHQNNILIESIGSMKDDIAIMKPLVEKIPKIEKDINLLQQALEETNQELISTNKRVGRLKG